MELMSMLLLCAFAASLPQSLGVNGVLNSEMVLNSSIMIENSVSAQNRHSQILSSNGQPVTNAITQLQTVYNDNLCKRCVTCMDRILKGQSNRMGHVLNSNHPDDFYEKQHSKLQANRNKRSIRFKRNATELKNGGKENLVTKYKNEDEKVYAIKIYDELGQKDNKSNCKVYSVKKSFPCTSSESDLFLAKRRLNKKGRKVKEKNRTTDKPKLTTGVSKKREIRIENSHVPESFMPSIELY